MTLRDARVFARAKCLHFLLSIRYHDTKTSLRQKINIGCLNVRGCQNLEERKTLIEDCQKYEFLIWADSDTHLAGTSLEQHLTSDKQNTTTKYAFFQTGSDDNTHHGVGLIIDQDLPPTFKRISDRICAASINLVNHKLIVISAYAPTLEVSEANPDVR